jgi:hypothetical protein
MKTIRIMAIAALIATAGLAFHGGQAQQVGARRIDLQRHDLSVTGREVIQTIVELEAGNDGPEAQASGRRNYLRPDAGHGSLFHFMSHL